MFRFLKYIFLIGLWGCSKEAQAQPHLGTVSPSASVQGTQVAVTLTGTGLTCSAVGLTVSGSGITVTSPTCVNATTLTANLIVTPSAAATTHTISATLNGSTMTDNGVNFTVTAGAGNFYIVSTMGVNPPTNSCAAARNNEAAPLLTVAAGIRCMSGGDRVYIRAGTYGEKLWNKYDFTIPDGPSPSQHTLISGYPGDARPLFNCHCNDYIMGLANVTNVTWQNMNIDGSNLPMNTVFTAGVESVHNFVMQYVDIYNCPVNCLVVDDYGSQTIDTALFAHMKVHDVGVNENYGTPGPHAIYAGEGTQAGQFHVIYDDIEIYNDNYHGNGACNSQAFVSYRYGTLKGTLDDITIRNSYFHDNSSVGILVGGGSAPNTISNQHIYNNVIAHNGAFSCEGITGLNIYSDGVTNAQIYNNTFYGNVNGYAIGQTSYTGIGSNNISIRNNIFYKNAEGDAMDPALPSRSGYVASNNLQARDPGFVNVSGANFHLASAGSLANGTGSPLTFTLAPTDKDGLMRPNPPSIGAYEFKGVAPPPTPH